jgi:hypothetical protein
VVSICDIPERIRIVGGLGSRITLTLRQAIVRSAHVKHLTVVMVMMVVVMMISHMSVILSAVFAIVFLRSQERRDTLNLE